MNCWICGSKGDSGEHSVKSSDLKMYFEEVTQKNPLHWYSKAMGLKKVGGLKSDILKFKELICAKCNNQVSQPYDRAWEKLSSYLHKNLEAASGAGIVHLHKEFPGENIDRLMLGVHLYFVKIFGCLINAGNIPIDSTSFSQSFLNGVSHKNVYIAVGRIKEGGEIKSVGITDVHALELDGEAVVAQWNYMLGELVVRIMYGKLKVERRLMRKCWHPKDHGYKLRVHRNNA